MTYKRPVNKHRTLPSIEEYTDTMDIMTDSDLKNLSDIKDIKQRVLAYINVEVLIEEILDIIENSEFVSLRSKRAKKFIDKKRPIFNLLIDIEGAKKSDLFKDKSNIRGMRQDDEQHFATTVIHRELIVKINSYIMSCLKQNPKLIDYITSKDIFKDCNTEERNFLNNVSLISNIFAIRFSEQTTTIATIEMLI
jgi:hypothetical protein